jgi:hypothetical protein
MLSKRWTPVLPILLTIIAASLCSQPSLAASLRCANVLSKLPSKPQESWHDFIQSISTGNTTGDQEPSGIVPLKTIDQPLLRDARLYQLHDFVATRPDTDPEIAAEIDQAQVGFKFLRYNCRYSKLQSLPARLYFFQSNDGGPIFSVDDFPRKNDFQNSQEYSAVLKKYLQDIDQIVRSNERDPKFNDYFNWLKGSDDNFFSWLGYQPPSIPVQGKIEKYPVSEIENSGKRRFATKETIDKGPLVVEIIDTVVEYRDSKTLKKKDLRLGRTTQRKWIDELMSVVFPEYASRRGWSRDFLKHLYQKVITTADSTRYIVVRKKDSAGKPGEIIATIGLNRAPYGTTRFFNRISQKWEEYTGPFGPIYGRDNNVDLDQSGMKPVPLLGMEEYLQIQLPRPTSISEISWPQMGKNSPKELLIGDNIAMDLTKPRYHGMGAIYEPVRFYVSPKDSLRTEAYTELVSTLLQSLFQTNMDLNYGLNGQYLYTYNPKEGVILYRRQGFNLIPEYPTQSKDGSDWQTLGASPQNFVRKAHAPSVTTDPSEAKSFIARLKATVEQLAQKDFPY